MTAIPKNMIEDLEELAIRVGGFRIDVVMDEDTRRYEFFSDYVDPDKPAGKADMIISGTRLETVLLRMLAVEQARKNGKEATKKGPEEGKPYRH